MKQRIFLILFLCGVTVFLSAQSPFFRALRLEESGRDAESRRVFESEEGFLFFGTDAGLFAYDGNDFTPYLRPDTTENHVTALFQTADKTLWVGYRDGAIFRLKNQKYRAWQPEAGTPAVPITGFAADRRGQLWIAAYGEGLYCFSENRLYNFAAEDGLSGNDIYDLTADAAGKVYAGTDSGISVVGFSDYEKSISNLTRDDGLPDNIVRTLLHTRSGDLWVGTYDRGVAYFDRAADKFQNPIPDWNYGAVTALEIFQDKELWIGTEENGVLIYNFADRKIRPVFPGETSKIYDLHRDREGNIWVLDNENGIRFAHRRFEFLALSVPEIQALAADSLGNIWLGTRNGLYKSAPGANGRFDFKPHPAGVGQNIISLFADERQNIWLGTFGRGIIVWNEKQQKIRHIGEKDGLKNGSILSINGDAKHLYAATLGGVSQIVLPENIFAAAAFDLRNFDKNDGLGTDYIYKIFPDKNENFWFATDGQGISVKRGNAIENYPTTGNLADTAAQNIPLRSVYSLTADRENRIWFSTADRGVFSFADEKFTSLQVNEHLHEATVTSLITDVNGDILITHTDGIDLLHPASGHLIYYNSALGIEDIDPALNAATRDPGGNIWLGVKQGLIRWMPLREKVAIHPRTVLHTVTVMSEPIDTQRVNEFSPQRNYLGFAYSGIWLTDPTAVRFRYKLAGYDPNWKETRDRRVSYSNLPPGDYVFHLQSTENTAWSDEPVVTYAFTILTPLWQRWWVIAGFVGFLFGGIYLLQKRREAEIKRENYLQRQQSESRLEVLKSQINPHFLFNSFNTLSATIEENPAQAVVYVEKLADFYRAVLEYRDRKFIPLSEELKLIKNYKFLLKQRFGNNFNLRCTVENAHLYAVVPMALQMLVENAVKHNVVSKSYPLTIEIIADSERRVIRVANNLQPKIHREKSTAFGLESLKRQYRYLTRKTVNIEKSDTHFSVELPLVLENDFC